VIDLEPHMYTITQEAKRLRAKLPPGHPAEVADLVSGGALHVLETLEWGCNAGPALIRVRARQGMLVELRRWDHGTRDHPVRSGSLIDYDDWSAVESTFDVRRCTPRPPIELMIDLLRAVVKLRLQNALAFVSHYLADNDHEVAARAFGIEADQMRTAAERARRELQHVLEDYEPRPALSKWERVEKLLRQGRSANEVAKTVGTSWDKVARIQDRIDPRAKARRYRSRPLLQSRPDISTAEVIQLRRAGKTQREIAAHFDVAQTSIAKRLKKAGLTGSREAPVRVAV
jgi:DNA-directed RNA polymerase specialized sigma24 family protein